MEKYISARKVLFLKLSTILGVVFIWLVLFLFFYLKKKKGPPYLIFFSVFYFYIFNVLNYTLFEFQSLIILKHFVPDLILIGQPGDKILNFVPLLTLTPKDLVTSLLNILLFLPFGFGLPFISKIRFNTIVVIGLMFSLAIEFAQFLTGYIANITFRVADVNDVLFNSFGTVIGVLLFAVFVKLFRLIPQNSRIQKNPIVKYIFKEVIPQPVSK